MPITWKNVNGSTGAGEAGQLMQGAQQSMNAGLASLRGALGERQDIQDANFQNDRSNNTNSVFAGLDNLKTVDEADAFAQSGGWDQLLQSAGPNVDQQALRGAFDQRMTSLQQGAVADRTFQQGELMAQLTPQLEEMRAGIISGNPDALAPLEDPDFRAQVAKAGQLDELLAAQADHAHTQSERDFINQTRGRQEKEWGFQDEQRAAERSLQELYASLSQVPTDNPGDATRFMNDIIAKAAAIPGATPDMLVRFNETVMNSLSGANRLAPTEAAQVAEWDAGYVERAAKNAFAAEDSENKPLPTRVNEVKQTWNELHGTLANSFSTEMSEILNQAMGPEGIKLRGADGEEGNFRVSQAQIENILRSNFNVGGMFWNRTVKFTATNLRDQLTDLVASESYRREWQDYNDIRDWGLRTDQEKLEGPGSSGTGSGGSGMDNYAGGGQLTPEQAEAALATFSAEFGGGNSVPDNSVPALTAAQPPENQRPTNQFGFPSPQGRQAPKPSSPELDALRDSTQQNVANFLARPSTQAVANLPGQAIRATAAPGRILEGGFDAMVGWGQEHQGQVNQQHAARQAIRATASGDFRDLMAFPRSVLEEALQMKGISKDAETAIDKFLKTSSGR